MTAWTEDDRVPAETVEGGSIDWATTTDMKLLREQAKRYDEIQARLLVAERESAMLRSEVDLASPVGQLFYKSYTGEWSPQAVREEAARYGVPFKGAAPQKSASTAEPRPYAVAEDHLEGSWGPRPH